MTPALDTLPPEIFLCIRDQLPHEDIKSLSVVNKKIHTQLVPHLFRYIRVDCPLPRDSGLSSVINKYGGNYILGVCLYVVFQPNPPNSKLEGTKVVTDHEKEKWYWDDYPDSVWARDASDIPIMHDLIQFKGMPKCTSLGIRTDGEEEFEIDGGWDENDLCDISIYFCTEVESWERVKEKEEMYGWRTAWNELWRDVAKYSKTERLDLFHFLPIKASSWLEPDWAAFVGRLKELNIRAYGQDNGAGWAANTLEGFCAFFHEMPEFLFQHATNLEHLYIAGHEDGHLGDSALRFEPNTMTQLKSLHLETMSITESLKDFLSGSNLESLRLENVGAWGHVGVTPTWADFWKAVREGNPSLKEVTYHYPKSPPLTVEEAMNGNDSVSQTDTEEEAQVRKMVSDDDSLIIWPYIISDDKYGDVFEMEEENREALVKGDDNTEYKLLMEDVQKRQ
ncbi:uncharacterized protein B0J16DRAFT_340424 [Fusarium flagelliforme]|uniref:uncharacterized protein n=1 Tax=Fusarium flagelliforme TaxID=2675880 RepID=UPI001E8E7C41|nr:uncharacterized protein B0J16DRAFT_340424 [Fusarium flagelliforme]KAH7184765.1 hypothetical protein B0J16DRAFT_340424 [Fusarium flagelliforme]